MDDEWKESFHDGDEEDQFSEQPQSKIKNFAEVPFASKQKLYDYLVRMTGRKDQSEELITELERKLEIPDDLCTLFSLARKRAESMWDADTSLLTNNAYENSQANQLVEIDHALAQMQGRDREILLLKLRYGFTDLEIASCMEIDAPRVKSLLESALHNFFSHAAVTKPDQVSEQMNFLEERLPQLEAHPLSPHSIVQTNALSQIIGNIDSAKKRKMSLRQFLALFIALSLAGVGLIYIWRKFFQI